MNKDNLQKELLERVKQGIKPSDLKKKPSAPSQNSTPASSPPISPIITPIDKKTSKKHGQESNSPPPIEIEKINQLQQDINYWSQTAQNHLTNLQRATAQLDQAEEQIKELQSQPNQLSQEIETALKEANQRIRELEAKNQQLIQNITQLENQSKTTGETKPKETKPKTFTCSDCQQTQPTQELSRIFGKFAFCRSCSKKARQQASQHQPEPQPQTFTCVACQQTHSGTPTKMKLDKTLQEYPICSNCRPTLKEFNEADLITDELWAKYPYSSASEILEREFGIKKEEKW